MKCPILSISVPKELAVVDVTVVDCLKEECAWWDELTAQCSCLNISLKLTFLYSEVAQIRCKIPHLEQFKRA